MSISEQNLNLNALKKAEFERAKFWWKLSNCANLLVIILSLIANIFSTTAPVSATSATLLIIFSFVAQWISDNAKSTADWALRQFEMWDGLGWKVNKKDLSEVLIHVSKSTRAKFEKEDTHPYFDSKEGVPNKRLVKNFMQSAFYTKYQTFLIAKLIFAITIFIVLMTIFTAVVTLQNNAKVDGQALSYIFLTAIQVVVATGYLRLCLDYWKFGAEAGVIENRACVLAEKETVSDLDAVRLAHDYQIARSKLPLIPEFVWKYSERDLNELWEKHRNS